jgi:ABC-type Zn uptake system ZnuABC Zn-binding protein ZnuA
MSTPVARRSPPGAALAALLALLVGAQSAAAEPLHVLTTTTDLRSLVEAVGGDRVVATSLATGTQDPHYLEPKPSYVVAARRADLLVTVGMELETGYLPLVLQGARNGRIQPGLPGHLDASSFVVKLEVPTGTIDRSMGDVHASGNPHWWLDPYNARRVAAGIADRLAARAPADAAVFRERAAAFRDALDVAMFGADAVRARGGDALWAAAVAGTPPDDVAGWAGRLRPFRGARVITYHRSWSYLLARFGLVSIGEIEPKPGIPPSPAHLFQLIERSRAEHVRLVLVEPFFAAEAPDLVASKVGATVLRLPQSVGGAATSPDYITHLDGLVEAVAAALAAAPGQD